MSNPTVESTAQFRAVMVVRAAALSTDAHALIESEPGIYGCSCNYGLGDSSGSLVRRFTDHLAEVSA